MCGCLRPGIIQREESVLIAGSWRIVNLHVELLGTVGTKLSARFFFHQRYIPIAMFATERFGEAHHVIGPFLLLFWRAPAHNLRHIGCVTITFCHFPFTIHQSVPVIAAAVILLSGIVPSCHAHSPRSQPGTIIPRVLPGIKGKFCAITANRLVAHLCFMLWFFGTIFYKNSFLK